MAADRIKAGEAYVEGSFDGAKLDKGLRRMQKRMQSAARAVTGVGKRLTLLGGGILAAFVPAISAASDLEETMNKFNVVFGKNAKQVKQWGDDFAGQVGRSKQQVADFLAGTQDLLVPLGFEEGEATRLSKELTGLAVDLASFNNLADDAVLRDLHAALTGSGEVMKKYGVVVSEARVKQELLNQSLDPRYATEAQKAQARLNLILRGTTAAQGDALRSAGSYANQKKRLAGVIRDTAAELGTKLLPVVTPWVMWAVKATQATGEWISQNEGLVRVLAVTAAGLAGVGGGLTTVGLALGVVSAATGGLTTLVGLGVRAWKYYSEGAQESAASSTILSASAVNASRAVAVLNRELLVTRGLLPGLAGGVGRVSGYLTGASTSAGLMGRALAALRPAWAFLAAHPVTTVFAGVAVIWGIVAAVRALSKESTTLNDEIREQQRLQIQAAAADRERLEQLSRLAEREKLTAAEMAEANKLLSALESRYGPLGAAVDKAAQKLDGLAAAQRRVNELMNNNKLDAARGALNETVGRIATLQPAADRQYSLDGLSEQQKRELFERSPAAYRKREETSRARQEIAKLETLAADLRERIRRSDVASGAAREPGQSGGVNAGARRAGEDLDRQLAEARVRATKDGIDEELALIDLRFEHAIAALAKEKQATEENVRKMRELQSLERGIAIADDNLRNDELAKRERERLAEEAQRDEQRWAEESRRHAELQAAEEQRVADDLAEARIRSTMKGAEREKALLKLRHDQEVRRLAEAGVLTDDMLAKMRARLKLEQGLVDQSSAGVESVSRQVSGATFSGRLAQLTYGAESDLPRRQLKETEKQTGVLVDIHDEVKFGQGGILLA